MRVMMIGGTGYLAYFTTAELPDRGRSVLAIGLGEPVPGAMPEGVETLSLDTDAADLDALVEPVRGADVVIHAAGADGRFPGPAPVIEEYRLHNVAPAADLPRPCTRPEPDGW